MPRRPPLRRSKSMRCAIGTEGAFVSLWWIGAVEVRAGTSQRPRNPLRDSGDAAGGVRCEQSSVAEPIREPCAPVRIHLRTVEAVTVPLVDPAVALGEDAEAGVRDLVLEADAETPGTLGP